MKVLFIHPNYPGQFRHLAIHLGAQSQNTVVFATKNENLQWKIPGVNRILYKPAREPHPSTHHYLIPAEKAVLEGQAVYRLAQQLKQQGFVPDLIYGHCGWGGTLFMKDCFPNTPLICYFEWFYRVGTDLGFNPAEPVEENDLLKTRMKNAHFLIDLHSCDRGISPTEWQRSQLPREFHNKISVIHDGIDIEYFQPKPGAKLVLPNLDLSNVNEIITYASRGMEPYRGFPQLIESLAYIQERRPNCHAVIVGDDRVAYGKTLPDGQSYKQLMLDKVPLDLKRVHFVGSLPYGEYIKVLQASSAHIYLTYPFVLSWSMLEAMAIGCLVIGSDTPPVREVIRDGENGLLVDFFSPQAIADRVDEVMDRPNRMAEVRAKARETVVERYSLQTLLPKQLKLMAEIAREG